MSGLSGFEVGANIPGLQQLGDEQQIYMLQFHAIMADLFEQNTTLSNMWQGGGSEGFQSGASGFDEHFNQILMGFSKMVQATENTAANYSDLNSYLNGLFG